MVTFLRQPADLGVWDEPRLWNPASLQWEGIRGEEIKNEMGGRIESH